MKLQHLTLLLVTLLIFSCSQKNSINSFSKRKYLPRFKENKTLIQNRIHVRSITSARNSATSSVEKNNNKPPSTINIKTFLESVNPKSHLPLSLSTKNKQKISGCDELILKNGEIIKVKVTEISTSKIKYKKCSNLNGPTYSVPKSDLFLVKYANGETEVFKTEEDKEQTINNVETDRDIQFYLEDSPAQNVPEIKVVEPNRLVSFILSLIGVVVSPLSLLLGLLFSIPAFISTNSFLSKT